MPAGSSENDSLEDASSEGGSTFRHTHREGGSTSRHTHREGGVDWHSADGPTVGTDLLPEHSFALCLTHDVDRPFKRVQALYNAARERDPRHLRALLPWREPNWQFGAVRSLEAELGVRSAFYFLDEQRLLSDRPPADWFDPSAWRLYADRYDVTDERIAAEIRYLDRHGWEVGLHGSYESYDDRDRLRAEKQCLESVLGHAVRGGRQHYLNRTLPETWRHHAAVGLEYDATLGSAETFGFQYGDTVHRPFGDEFVVFPLTIMEHALPDPGEDFERAWRACEGVLAEAAERGAIATVLWHPQVFDERDWPGYATIYRRLVERALELGAWVGPPGELYELLDHDDVAERGRWTRRTAGRDAPPTGDEGVAADGERAAGDGERGAGDGDRAAADGEWVVRDGERAAGDRDPPPVDDESRQDDDGPSVDGDDTSVGGDGGTAAVERDAAAGERDPAAGERDPAADRDGAEGRRTTSDGRCGVADGDE